MNSKEKKSYINKYNKSIYDTHLLRIRNGEHIDLLRQLDSVDDINSYMISSLYTRLLIDNIENASKRNRAIKCMDKLYQYVSSNKDQDKIDQMLENVMDLYNFEGLSLKAVDIILQRSSYYLKPYYEKKKVLTLYKSDAECISNSPLFEISRNVKEHCEILDRLSTYDKRHLNLYMLESLTFHKYQIKSFDIEDDYYNKFDSKIKEFEALSKTSLFTSVVFVKNCFDLYGKESNPLRSEGKILARRKRDFITHATKLFVALNK